MTNKVALNSFDDKRFTLSDGITTLPHGHFWLEQNRAVDEENESFVNDGNDTSSSSSSSDEMEALVGRATILRTVYQRFRCMVALF